MIYSIPPSTHSIPKDRAKKGSKTGRQLGGTYAPFWLLIAAFLIMGFGIARLLSRPADRWIRSIRPAPVITQANMAELVVEPAPSQAALVPKPTTEPFFEIQEERVSQKQVLGLGEELTELIMFNERRGWGKGDAGVWYTSDGGLSWRRIFPQNPHSTRTISSSFFLSETEAWISTYEEANGEITTLYKTVNAGQTWSSSPIPNRFAHMFFQDSLTGWAWQSNDQPGVSPLIFTQDGGNSWSEVSDLLKSDSLSSVRFLSPILLDSMFFMDQTNGWGVGPDRTGQTILYQTIDGGNYWRAVDLEFDEQHQEQFVNINLPRFFGPDKESGVLPVLLYRPGSKMTVGEVIFYLSEDRGHTWTKTAPVKIETGRVTYDILSPTEVIVLDGNQMLSTTDAAVSWNRSVINIEHLLTADDEWNGMDSIQFKNWRTGWGWRRNEVGFSLYRTQNGGLNWQQINPIQERPGTQGCDVQVQASRRSSEISQQAGPYLGWAVYSPAEYGFSLKYPPGWRLLEVYQLCPGVKSSLNSIMILAPRELGGYLVIGFRRSSEQVNITFSLPQVGEWIDDRQVFLFNETISRNKVVYMGEERAIFYQMGNEIYIGNMVFSFSLIGSGEPGAERPLEPEVQFLADQIVQSIDLSRANATLLHGMEVLGFISISPDSLWQAEMLFTSPVKGKGLANQRFQSVTLYSGNDSLPPLVLLDRWLTEDQVDTSPGGFTWSPDGNHLFFYESAYFNQCFSYPYHLNLRQVNLNSLQMVDIPLLTPDQRPSIGLSPDTRWLAYLSQAAIPERKILYVRNLVTGQEQAIPFPNPAFLGSYEAGKILWSPDSKYLAFMVSSVTCVVEDRSHQVVLVDIERNSAKLATRLEDNLTVDNWDAHGRLILVNQDNDRIPMDISSDSATLQPVHDDTRDRE